MTRKGLICRKTKQPTKNYLCFFILESSLRNIVHEMEKTEFMYFNYEGDICSLNGKINFHFTNNLNRTRKTYWAIFLTAYRQTGLDTRSFYSGGLGRGSSGTSRGWMYAHLCEPDEPTAGFELAR